MHSRSRVGKGLWRWGRVRLLLVLLVALVVSAAPGWLAPPPAEAAPAALSPGSTVVSQGRSRYFPQTAHFLRGAFLAYWETHGATPILGLPITEPIVEDGLTVQYLERARLEWHPSISPDPARAILLTRLGAIMTEARGLFFEPLPSGQDTPTSVFFEETGHNLSNAFLNYWRRNGGLAVFGYPISEEFAEVNPADGQVYTVQYFERNRFEWHPERPAAFNVQLGLLGVEYARYLGLDPLARVLLPAALPEGETDLSDDPRLDALVEDELLPAMRALGRTPEFQWVPAVIIRNRIFVGFDDVGEEGVAGAFFSTRERPMSYFIVVSERYRDASPEAIASILAHEATHAYDFTGGVQPLPRGCSIDEELRSYMNGLAAWIVLGGSDALSRTYAPGSAESRLSRSLAGFNDGKTYLDFDFDAQAGREFLRELYGPDCR